MSIIELETPWCFNTEELTEGEVIELGKHFVKEGVNYKYPWSNADSAQIYVGINSNNGSDYNCSIKEFDEDDNIEESVTVYTIEQLRTIIAEHLAKQPVEKLEDGVVYYIHHTLYGDWQYLAINKVAYVNINQRAISTAGESWEHKLRNKEKYVFTKATPAQIAHYETCVKAGKYVEPESVTEFVVGKWYKYRGYYLKYKGKDKGGYWESLESIDKFGNFSTQYSLWGGNNEKKLLEDLSEIQELLPEGHPDLIVKPKSERYLATMKFFEQLREPERSEAIANYDEEYSICIPKGLQQALSGGFCWDDTKQFSEYWEDIHTMILEGTYFKKELLVFGKYKVGDIVVDICHAPGKMVEVDALSSSNILVYGGSNCTYDHPKYLRPATPEEVEAYNQGVRNIADIKPKDYKEAVHCTTQEEWDFVLSKFNPRGMHNYFNTYKEKSAIVTSDVEGIIGCHGAVDFISLRDYTILTFKQWCDKYAHSYEVKPWVAQVGDWVYVLNSGSSCLLAGDIVKCDHHSSAGNAHFETFRRTNNSPNSYLSYENYRKATQEEIDSVTKSAVANTQIEWTADNWYVEVTSQEEANAVIDAAAKMYGKKADKTWCYSEEYCAVSLERNISYRLEPKWYIERDKKPRPIADFIQPEKQSLLETVKKTFFDKPIQQSTPDYSYLFAGEVTEEEFDEIKRLCKPQQDELVIYKPKRVIL